MDITYLPLEEMKTGHAYKVRARHLEIAIWTGKYFVGLRTKFSDQFIDREDHWDTGAPHGTVKPIKELT